MKQKCDQTEETQKNLTINEKKKKKKHYRKILLRPNIDFSFLLISLHIQQQSVSIITSHRGDSKCMFNSIKVSARDVCIKNNREKKTENISMH